MKSIINLLEKHIVFNNITWYEGDIYGSHISDHYRWQITNINIENQTFEYLHLESGDTHTGSVVGHEGTSYVKLNK
jgi:hypothetical protein